MKHPFLVIGVVILLVYLYEQNQLSNAAASVTPLTPAPTPINSLVVTHVDGSATNSLSGPVQTIFPTPNTDGGTSFQVGPTGIAITIEAAQNPNAHTGPISQNIGNAISTSLQRSNSAPVADDLNFGSQGGQTGQVIDEFGRYVGLLKKDL